MLGSVCSSIAQVERERSAGPAMLEEEHGRPAAGPVMLEEDHGGLQAQLHPGATPQQIKVWKSLKVKTAATCNIEPEAV